MKRLLALTTILFLLGCSTDSFSLNQPVRPIRELTVSLSAQFNRSRIIELPLTIDSSVVLSPLDSDSTLPVYRFSITSWEDNSDQDELLQKISALCGFDFTTLEDCVLYVPQTVAHTNFKACKESPIN